MASPVNCGDKLMTFIPTETLKELMRVKGIMGTIVNATNRI